MNTLITIINATPLLLIGILFVAVHLGFTLWAAFAHYVVADTTYLKLDKFLKKRGMFGFLIVLQVLMMAFLLIYAILLTLINLGVRL